MTRVGLLKPTGGGLGIRGFVETAEVCKMLKIVQTRQQDLTFSEQESAMAGASDTDASSSINFIV